MKHKWRLTFLVIVVSAVGVLGVLHYLRGRMPMEIYVTEHSFSCRQFAAASVAFASLEELDVASLTDNPSEKLHFTFAETVNFGLFQAVLNECARSGQCRVKWRLEGGREHIYYFPGCGEPSLEWLWVCPEVAEDLAFVQVNGGNACLCAITVSAEGLAVTENPMSTEELLAAIKVISKGVTIDRCFVDMVSTADVPQKAASGLFDLIDSHRWQCQITIHEDLPSNEFDGSRLGLLWNTPKHFRWPLPTFLKSQALLKTYRI